MGDELILLFMWWVHVCDENWEHTRKFIPAGALHVMGSSLLKKESRALHHGWSEGLI